MHDNYMSTGFSHMGNSRTEHHIFTGLYPNPCRTKNWRQASLPPPDASTHRQTDNPQKRTAFGPNYRLGRGTQPSRTTVKPQIMSSRHVAPTRLTAAAAGLGFTVVLHNNRTDTHCSNTSQQLNHTLSATNHHWQLPSGPSSHSRSSGFNCITHPACLPSPPSP